MRTSENRRSTRRSKSKQERKTKVVSRVKILKITERKGNEETYFAIAVPSMMFEVIADGELGEGAVSDR